MRISDWSSDVCSSDLQELNLGGLIFRSSNHSVLGESGRGKAAKRGRSEQGGSRLQLHWVTPLWCTGLVSRRALGGCGDRSEPLLLQLGDNGRCCPIATTFPALQPDMQKGRPPFARPPLQPPAHQLRTKQSR